LFQYFSSSGPRLFPLSVLGGSNLRLDPPFNVSPLHLFNPLLDPRLFSLQVHGDEHH